MTNSINKSLSYLDNNYNKTTIYEDNYLKFIYPEENLPLNLTYRKIDAYTNLIYIDKELGKDKTKKINYQIEEANNNLNSLIPYFENKSTFNTIKNVSDGYALDTYCILGHLFNNTKIANNIKGLIINDNLMQDNYYKEDKWRNIADETWCILLLNNINKNVASALTDIKINETYNFLNSQNTIQDKAVVLIHIILLTNELNHDNGYFKNELYQLSLNDEIKNDILIKANILYVLAESNYPKEKLKPIYESLIEKQHKDGGVYLISNYGNAFITQRAILAINAYESL